MKIFVPILFLATIMSISAQTSNRSPPPDYECLPGAGYYKFEQQWLTFDLAKRHCERSGAHLAIITSQLEATALANYIRNRVRPGQLWPRLGFGDFFERGDFVTIYDKSLNATGYDVWYPGQPALQYERNCGCMNVEGLLGTQCCDCNVWFICEFDTAPGMC